MLVRKIIWMMSSAMAMTVVMVVSITAWTAQRNNERAAADSSVMVRGGLDGMIRNLASLNFDYSAWNAGLGAAVRRDTDWLGANMGNAANGREFHLLELHWPTDWSSLTWTTARNEAGLPPSAAPVVSGALIREIHADLNAMPLGEGDTTTFALSRNDFVYIAAATRMQPWMDDVPVPIEELPINVMAFRFTDDMLANLAATFLIEDLALRRVPPPEDVPFVTLDNLEGETVRYLTWTPPRPGDAQIEAATIPIAIGLVLFLGLAGSVTLTARRNATDLVLREQEAATAARTDTMTDLPNRMAFNEALAELRRGKSRLALFFMDLNGLKAINDEHGQLIGDRLLAEIAEAARDCKRRDDLLARVGGDEFILISKGTDAEAACHDFYRAFAKRMDATIDIDGVNFHPKFSIGYSVGHSQEDGTTELLRQADYAMYAAKLQKSPKPVKYDIALERDKLQEVEITAALRKALDRGEELSVVYQPIVNARTGRVVFAEALVRWTSPMLGNVPPGAFISIAEKTGLIVDLGRRVMDMVFRDLAEMPDLHVSINLSPVQLRSRSILGDIKALVAQHGIAPNRVKFEVTEGVMIECDDLIAFIFDSLREDGFALALDDFGTGFSSIGYLRKFRFDTLKIDKSFVDDIGIASNGENLMRALVYLARSLDMQVVAEGVEMQEQSDCLRDEGFDLLQGYLISRPLPFGALKTFCENRPSRAEEETKRANIA